MDSSFIPFFTDAGFAGLVVLLILMGWLVPKPYYKRLEDENKALRESRDLERQRASEAASTAGVANQLIGALADIAHENRSQPAVAPSAGDGRARADLTWRDLT